MTEFEKKEFLKKMDNADESDETLSVALLTAKYAILERAYPYEKDFDSLVFPSRYDMLQVQIADVLIKKVGAEGETVHMENGIHRHYESAMIPESLLQSVVPKVGVIK